MAALEGFDFSIAVEAGEPDVYTINVSNGMLDGTAIEGDGFLIAAEDDGTFLIVVRAGELALVEDRQVSDVVLGTATVDTGEVTETSFAGRGSDFPASA